MSPFSLMFFLRFVSLSAKKTLLGGGGGQSQPVLCVCVCVFVHSLSYLLSLIVQSFVVQMALSGD